MENIQEKMKKMKKELMAELEKHICKFTGLQITLENSRAFNFEDSNDNPTLEFNGMIDGLKIYSKKSLTRDDAPNIGKAIFDYLARKGFEVFGCPDEPNYVVGTGSGEPLHMMDWEIIRSFESFQKDLVDMFQFWVDGWFCSKKDLRDMGSNIFYEENHKIKLVKYEPPNN